MKYNVKLIFKLLIFLPALTGCSAKSTQDTHLKPLRQGSALYATKGTEHKVQFRGLFRSDYTNVSEIQKKSLRFEILELTPFLFGPLTYRSTGGVQKGESIEPLVNEAFIENNRVMIPFNYSGIWLIQTNGKSTLNLPLPYSLTDLRNSNWQSCTDNYDEDHRTWGFLWYFWDPLRPGCQNLLNRDFQIVEVEIGDETAQTKLTYPEYNRMIHTVDGIPTLAMTFAFGYVQDRLSPNPFKDSDFGMREFQKFHRASLTQLLAMGFQQSPIYQKDITDGAAVIGSLFTGTRNGINVKVSILAAAGVDQMDIFANSFAQKHEGFFSWFGHSRVGAGFDADSLKSKVSHSRTKFSISNDYQLIYWAGCNSYSYYTLPFFEMKAITNPSHDDFGTKNLDIISNTLPSLFAFNAANAEIMFHALINWTSPTSYQMLVDQIETNAGNLNFDVMVNVLGDEDNSQAP